MGEIEKIETEAAAIRGRLGEGKSSGVITATDGAVLADLIKRMAKAMQHKEKNDA